MTYEPSPRRDSKRLACAFFSFSGTPTASNPLTPAVVGSSSAAFSTISSNDIQLPAGEYILRFYGAVTRTSSAANIKYQWREVGGALIGLGGATNRELAPGTQKISLDSADAHLILSSSGAVQIEMTSVDAGITLDTSSTHAVIWRLA